MSFYKSINYVLPMFALVLFFASTKSIADDNDPEVGDIGSGTVEDCDNYCRNRFYFGTEIDEGLRGLRFEHKHCLFCVSCEFTKCCKPATTDNLADDRCTETEEEAWIKLVNVELLCPDVSDESFIQVRFVSEIPEQEYIGSGINKFQCRQELE